MFIYLLLLIKKDIMIEGEFQRRMLMKTLLGDDHFLLARFDVQYLEWS